jgi:hypothetical protein
MRQTTGFVRLPGGLRIAFAVVGSGPAVVLPAWWVSNVVEDWHFRSQLPGAAPHIGCRTRVWP